MLAHGTTTTEAKSGYGLTTSDEIKMLEAIGRLDVEHAITVLPNFCGAHEVSPEYRGRTDAYVDLVVREMLPEVARRGLARYVDVFCEEGVFSLPQTRRVLEAGARHGLRAKFHADEFATLGGAALAAEMRALSADHLLAARVEDVARMKEAGVTATLLPGTAFFLGLPYAPARKFLDTGARVNPGQRFQPRLLDGVQPPARDDHGGEPDEDVAEEALLGVTLNAAHAMGLEAEIGSLAPASRCDLLVADVPR
jgi:imidazolonepropionase